MIKFGVTEAGDAGLDFSWKDKLLEGNIIITKHMTVKNKTLNKLLLNNKDRIILHATCTGYGGTRMEPNVPKPYEIYQGVRELINAGFPASHIVLRVDPIIPTLKGIDKMTQPLILFEDTGVKRVRYSIIDMYRHVKQRFMKEYGSLPFDSFKAPNYMVENLLEAIEPYRDYEILGIDPSLVSLGGFQRSTCACCAGKTELLSNKKRCPSGCLYCYWKD